MSKRNTEDNIKVEDKDKVLKTGKITIGDKNWPKNQNVVSFPISLPLICGGTIFITHIFVLGIIMPIPKPATIIATTSNRYVLENEMQRKPVAISKYPNENTARKLSLPFI